MLGRWPIARRLLVDYCSLRFVTRGLAASRGQDYRCLHQCRRQSVCRDLQPTERIFRHSTGQLRSEPSQVVSAKHKLCGLVFPVYDSAGREDERVSWDGMPGSRRKLTTARPTFSTCTPAM